MGAYGDPFTGYLRDTKRKRKKKGTGINVAKKTGRTVCPQGENGGRTEGSRHGKWRRKTEERGNPHSSTRHRLRKKEGN